MKKKVMICGLYSIGICLSAFTFFSDTIPYNFESLKPLPDLPINNDNPVTVQGADLGKHLFYDPILSKDSSISCSSCHKQEFAFSDSPKQFSIGIKGTDLKRNTMPLFNLAWNSHQFWDGRVKSIEDQVFHPVREPDEMDLDWNIAVQRLNNSLFYQKKFELTFGKVPIDSILVSKAIGQFERTLISNNSKYDFVIRGKRKFTEDEYQGFVMVNDQSMADCLHCHPTDGGTLGTTGKFSNNGIEKIVSLNDYVDKGKGGVSGDESETGLFRIPPLRNIAITAPYMHDGRFKTLKEVLDFYSEGINKSPNIDPKMTRVHEGGLKLTEKEKYQIIAFLQTLTDSVFIADSKYSNPFVKKTN